jgi:hypothetical protein
LELATRQVVRGVTLCAEAGVAGGLGGHSPVEPAAYQSALEAGRPPVAIHAIGDRAVDLALDSVEAAQRARPRPDVRHRIGHAGAGVDDFHEDVPSNAGPKVAFRCNYPRSRTVAGFLRVRDGQDMSAALEQPAVGQAYVSTPEQATARKCSRRGTEPTT